MRGGLKDSPLCGRYMGEAEAAGLWAGVWARGEGVGGAGPEGASPSPPPTPQSLCTSRLCTMAFSGFEVGSYHL